MKISKKRLAEIEKEVSGLTIHKLAVRQLMYNLKCSICGIEGVGHQFSHQHFDNCRFNGIDLTQLNEDIPKYDVSVILSKYGINRSSYKVYKNYHKIKKEHYLVKRKREGWKELHPRVSAPRDSNGRYLSTQK